MSAPLSVVWILPFVPYRQAKKDLWSAHTPKVPSSRSYAPSPSFFCSPVSSKRTLRRGGEDRPWFGCPLRRLCQVLTQGLCLLKHQINGSDLLIWRVFVSLEERLDLEAEFRPDVPLKLPVEGGVTSEGVLSVDC